MKTGSPNRRANNMGTVNGMEVNCPHCGQLQDFSDPERWKDGFKDDSEPIEVECEDCDGPFMVQPHVTIRLEVEEEE